MAGKTKKREFNYGDSEARNRKAVERLGTLDAKCIICGEPSAICLERHHVAGREYHDETVFLCRNHHAKASDRQKDYPLSTSDEKSPLEIIGRFCLGLSDLISIAVEEQHAPALSEFLSYVGNTLNRIGRTLISMAQGVTLDQLAAAP